jgi:type VI protein secretion system component Hcp
MPTLSTPYLFLKLTSGSKPIEGEATERFFEKQIGLESMSWHMASTHEASEDIRGTKKVKTTNRPGRVELTKVFDRSTINMCSFLAKRTAFDKATITMLRGMAWDEKPRPLVEIELSVGYVENVALSAAESGNVVAVSETVTLSYRRFKIVYYPNLTASGRSQEAATTFDLSLPSVSD